MIARDEDGKFLAFTQLGMYPIYHVCADGGVLCHDCVNNQADVGTSPNTPADWRIVASDINYEDPDLQCDHCNKRIESAYAED